MLPLLVYSLCLATSAACAWLLLRAHRRSRTRLLLWSGLCFVGMALNNLLLIVDVHVLPAYDLAAMRLLPALAGTALLLFGLVWETRR
jgi:hypothetical protein